MAVLRGLSEQVSQEVVELDADGTSVGRADNQQLVLHDGSVSGKHARIWCETKWLVQDLGSTNGTLLNGAMLDAHEVFELADGDRVSFGRVTMEFQAAGASGALAEARAALDAAEAALNAMRDEIALLRDHAAKQDEAIRSRDEALAEWERRMESVNSSWVSKEDFQKELAREKEKLDLAAQGRIDAAVRRYNEMEARYVQSQAKLETAEKSLREKEDELRLLALKRA